MDENIIINFKKLFYQICQYHDGIKKYYMNFDLKTFIDLISETWNKITVDVEHLWKKLS